MRRNEHLILYPYIGFAGADQKLKNEDGMQQQHQGRYSSGGGVPRYG